MQEKHRWECDEFACKRIAKTRVEKQTYFVQQLALNILISFCFWYSTIRVEKEAGNLVPSVVETRIDMRGQGRKVMFSFWINHTSNFKGKQKKVYFETTIRTIEVGVKLFQYDISSFKINHSLGQLWTGFYCVNIIVLFVLDWMNQFRQFRNIRERLLQKNLNDK